jgi:hypothetical protein
VGAYGVLFHSGPLHLAFLIFDPLVAGVPFIQPMYGVPWGGGILMYPALFALHLIQKILQKLIF